MSDDAGAGLTADEQRRERMRARGYHLGSADTVISVEDVNRQAQAGAGAG